MTHILCMGGGGFSKAPDGAATALDRHALELTGKSNPLVCFAPTASADDPQYIHRFLTAFGGLGVQTMVLTLWQDSRHALERFGDIDLLYVGGGSTVNLMALWDAHGVSQEVRDLRAERDVVFAGVSAGANVWCEGCTTDSFGGIDPWRGGLGFVRGSFSPHFDSEADRAPQFLSWVREGDLPVGWAADDGAALHVLDGKVQACLAEREGAKVYRVDRTGITAQPMTRLG
ncbi:peptidase E [Arsenicicoccus dermatophilus]|uniref:Type 1 glutamine amidotransferase-like domain-containing protein n=1 Tax=Arsenicicoccus dermatophilus TaxID=1076331 RepID=UPI001F4C81D8|nr:peptidase E [Arsenicicoccus dermatophilus]MCH8611521.1 peptidase E [Arsenicicoccus dermatophilus]